MGSPHYSPRAQPDAEMDEHTLTEMRVKGVGGRKWTLSEVRRVL